LDIDRLRADTPGTAHGAHLLACGSSLPPAAVLRATIEHLELEARIGGYEAAAQRTDALDGVYDSVARLIGAHRDEIALLENASVAWCQAFYALPLQPGLRILTGEAEYAANYVAFLQRAKRDGVRIDVVPSDADGVLDVAALASMIDDSVGLIAITWVPTNGGLVNPAAQVGRIARRHGIPYLLDACQAIGQMPIDVEELGCDFLSATGRKFLRGPRGTGFLYVRRPWLERLEPAMIDFFGAPWVATDRYELRPDARRFETWENAYALRAGLGAAVDYALELGIQPIQDRVRHLADTLRVGLADVPGATLWDLGRERCAIVSFSVDSLDPATSVTRLRDRGISIGTSKPGSTRLDAEARNLPTMLRAAPHVYNTRDDIDRLIEELGRLARSR